MRFLTVNCEEFESFCKAFSIKKYPTFKILHGHEEIDYNGSRETKDLLDFSKKVLGPNVIEVTDEEMIEVWEKQEVSFTLFYSQQSELDLYRQVAKTFEYSHMWFYASPSPAQSSYLQVSGKDSRQNYVQSQLTLSSLVSFINLHAFPTILELNIYNLPLLTSNTSGKRIVMLISLPYDLDNRRITDNFVYTAWVMRSKQVDNIQAAVLISGEYMDFYSIYNIDTFPTVIVSELQEGEHYYKKVTGVMIDNYMMDFMIGVSEGSIELEPFSVSYWHYFKEFAKKADTWEFWIEALKFMMFPMVMIMTVLPMCVGMFAKEKEE